MGDKSSSYGYYGNSLAALSHVEMDASSTLAFTQAMIACKFPHVTHLDLVQKSLCWGDDHIHKLLSVGSLPSLTNLSLRKKNICSVSFEEKLLQNETVRNLRHFHLSDLQLGSVSHFFRSNKGFPNLRSLAFSGCIRHSQDLRILAQASDMGLLPVLEHLDLSKIIAYLISKDFLTFTANGKLLNVSMLIEKGSGRLTHHFKISNVSQDKYSQGA